MALGTNYKRLGRKDNLITGIQLKLSRNGKSIEEIRKETKNYHKKSVDDLLHILKSINILFHQNKCPECGKQQPCNCNEGKVHLCHSCAKKKERKKPKPKLYKCMGCGETWYYYRQPSKCHICEFDDMIKV